jgi:hypothetical protein
MLDFKNVREEMVVIAQSYGVDTEILKIEGEKERYVKLIGGAADSAQGKLDISANCFVGKHFGALTLKAYFFIEPFKLSVNGKIYNFRIWEYSGNISKFPYAFQLNRGNLEEALQFVIDVMKKIKNDLSALPDDPNRLLDSNIRGSNVKLWSGRLLHQEKSDDTNEPIQLRQWVEHLASET